MKNWNLICRRTHLYLGMLLMPWVFVYAFSTFMINHGPFFRQFRGKANDWTRVWEKPCHLDLPSGQPQLRALAGELLEQNNLGGGPYGVQRRGGRVIINAPRFLHPMRLIYLTGSKKLVAQQHRPTWVEVFLRLHFRVGYGRFGTLQNLWGLIVDLVCVSFLVWLGTGLYLWWKLPQTRPWGWLAIGAGFVSFFTVLLGL